MSVVTTQRPSASRLRLLRVVSLEQTNRAGPTRRRLLPASPAAAVPLPSRDIASPAGPWSVISNPSLVPP